MKHRLPRIAGAALVLAAGGASYGDTVVRSIRYRMYFGVEAPPAVESGPVCFEDGCIGWPVAPHPQHPDTINIFHTDVDVTYDGCPPGGAGWDVFISHDYPNPDRRVELDQALLYANQFARIVVPTADFAFTGAGPGDDLWVLPQGNPGNVLYFGIASPISTQIQNTYLAPWSPPGLGPSRWIAWRLRSVAHDAQDDGAFNDDGVFSVWQSAGPGQVALYMSSFDDQVPGNGVDSDGISDADVFYDSAGGHTHMNWGFSEPGVYMVEFQAETVITLELPTPRFDLDWDGDVDLADWAAFQVCAGAATEPYACGCEWADPTLDGAVTAADLEYLLDCWSAPETAADPNCAN